ncbi:unnamed protein product [Amoebophrya sp. A25]|nr:unnamed protein product [Amoebophrya sp. A25]|eukprot:GSA25T00024442001.1
MDEMPAAVSLMNGLRVCLEQAGDELEKQVNKAAQMRFFPRGLVKSLFSGSSSSTRTSVVGKTGGRGGPSSSSASLNNRRRVDSSRRGGSSSSTRPQLRRRSSTPRGGTTSNYTKEAGNLLQGSGSSTPRTGSTGVRVKRSFLEDQVPQVVLDDDKLILNGKEFIRKEGNNVRRREQHHQFTKRNNRNLGTQQQRTRADTPRPPILTTASRTRRGNPSSGVSSASSQITSSTGSATSSNLVGISPGGVVSPQLVTGTAGVAGTISTLLPLNPSSASIPGLPNPASIPGLRPQHHNATSIPTIVPTSMVPTTMAQPTGVTSSGCGNNLVPAAPHLMLGGKTMTPARVSTTTAARTLGKKLPSLLRSPPQDPGECPTSASTLYSDAMASSRKTEKSSQMQGVALFF